MNKYYLFCIILLFVILAGACRRDKEQPLAPEVGENQETQVLEGERDETRAHPAEE